MKSQTSLKYLLLIILWVSGILSVLHAQDKYYFESPFMKIHIDTLRSMEKRCSDPDSLLHIKFCIAEKDNTASKEVRDKFYEFMELSLEQQDSFSYYVGAMYVSIPLINVSKFDKADSLLQRSLRFFEGKDERLWLKCQIFLGFLHTASFNYRAGLEYLKRAERNCDKDKYPKEYHDIINRLGLLYSKIDETSTSIKYYKIIINNCEEKNNCFLYRAALNNVLSQYIRADDSLNYFKATDKLIKMRQKSERDIDKKMILYYKARRYYFQDDLASIEPLIDSILYYSYRRNHISATCYDHFYAYDYYQKTNNLPKQLEHLEKMLRLASENQLYTHINSAAEKLGFVYTQLGEYEKAAKAFAKSFDAREAQDEENKIRRFKIKESNLIKENYDLQVKNMEQNAALLKSKNRNYQFRLIGVSVMGVVLLLVMIYIYQNYLQKSRMEKRLEKQKQVIEKNLKEKELLLKEIHHRVKNNMQIVSGILSIQAETIQDEKAKSAFIDGQSRINSMAMIHQNLYQSGTLASIGAKKYFTRLINRLLETYSNVNPDIVINVDFDIDDCGVDMEEMVSLGLIVNELITNSLKYAFKGRSEGNLYFAFKKIDNLTQLIVADDGIGFDPKTIETMQSFGWRMVHSFASKMDADMDINNENGMHISLRYKNKLS